MQGVILSAPDVDLGGHTLTSAEAPNLTLPDLRTGTEVQLSGLRGKKVVLLAWSSW